MNCFPDKLHFEAGGIRGGQRIFILLAPFRYISQQGVITVPAGTVTDGASIPRIFHSIIGPCSYFKSAVIHDFLYSAANSRYTRYEADNIFKEAMYNNGVPWYLRDTIYRAVRIFGGRSYKGKLL